MPFELGGRADKQGNRYEHNNYAFIMMRQLILRGRIHIMDFVRN